MCVISIPDTEANRVPAVARVRSVKYSRPGDRTVIGDLIAITDDTILIRVPRRRDPVACWTHGTFDLVWGGAFTDA